MRKWIVEGLSNLLKYPIKFFLWTVGILIEAVAKAAEKADR